MAETETIIRNTGGAAGVTAQQVADMASAMSDAAGKSTFGDDQIQAAQNVILKYKELKVPLQDVTQLSIDMATTAWNRSGASGKDARPRAARSV